MSFRKSGVLALVLCIGLCSVYPNPCQASKAEDDSKDDIGVRIKRQHNRIRACVRAGTITAQKASDLDQSLDNLQATVSTQRNARGGQLKPEQLKEAENILNQNHQIIKSFEAAGTSKVESGKVLGPKWTTGKDGAQNPKSLLKQMKQEERRELRQEKQATEQKIEQQQLDYEKQMVPDLAGQRKDILKQKQDLKDIRKEAGAD